MHAPWWFLQLNKISTAYFFGIWQIFHKINERSDASLLFLSYLFDVDKNSNGGGIPTIMLNDTHVNIIFILVVLTTLHGFCSNIHMMVSSKQWKGKF